MFAVCADGLLGAGGVAAEGLRRGWVAARAVHDACAPAVASCAYLAHRQTLGQRERGLYDLIDNAVARREPSVVLPGVGSFARAAELYHLVCHDRPGYIYASRTICGSDPGPVSGDVRLDFVYRMESEAAGRALRKMERRATRLLRNVDRTAPAGAIALQVHDLLLRDFTYTYQDMEPDEMPDEVDGADDCHFAHAALIGRNAVCDGWSLAYKYLLDRVGVASAVVWGQAGDAENPAGNHAWNVVDIADELGGRHRWSHVDVTWDGTCSAADVISHGNFGLDGRQAAMTHTIESPGFDPVCVAADYYRAHGLRVGCASQAVELARRSGFPRAGFELQLPPCGDADAQAQCQAVAKRLSREFGEPVRTRLIPERRVVLVFPSPRVFKI